MIGQFQEKYSVVSLSALQKVQRGEFIIKIQIKASSQQSCEGIKTVNTEWYPPEQLFEAK